MSPHGDITKVARHDLFSAHGDYSLLQRNDMPPQGSDTKQNASLQVEKRPAMRKLWLLLLMVIPLQLIHAQEVKHAPPVAQCRTDQRLWHSKLKDEVSTVAVSFLELEGWTDEMIDCYDADPTFQIQYHKTIREIYATGLMRLRHFLERRNLVDQFLVEDELWCRGSEPCKARTRPPGAGGLNYQRRQRTHPMEYHARHPNTASRPRL